MPTLAVIGAGPGLGAAVARKFGAAGFHIALLSRTQANVDALAAELGQAGITARGYTADVRDAAALTTALDRAAAELGPIEVLQYSPIPQREFLRPVLETTAADLRAALEFSVLGPLTAVAQVLGGMREAGQGTVLFVNGSSAIRPNATYAGTSIAFAGESAYAQMLHDALTGSGVHVGQLIIPGAIRPGHPTHDPDVLAEKLWTMHTTRGDFRTYAEPLTD